MSKPSEILLERIDQRLAEMGRTRYWLSMQVTGGRHQSVIRDIARRGSLPNAERLVEIARLLDTTTDYLMGSATSPEPLRSEVSVSDRRIAFKGPDREAPGLPLVGTGDCADLEVSTETGEMASIDRASFDPDYHITYVTRPAALRGDREAYAIYFHGESMIPRFEPGEVGIAQPSRPAAPGDYVIVQLRNGSSDDVGGVIVKRLVRQNSREITLEQFNPPLVFTLPRSKVMRMHRLMPHDSSIFA